MTTNAQLAFVPWFRQGLAAAITANTLENGAARLAAGVTVTGGTAQVNLRLYGPGAIAGIDPRQVIRTDPPAGATDFPPARLPLVEFDRPDYPWLFTPTAPEGDRLRPWLVLIVVRRQPGVALVNDPSGTVRLAFTSPAVPGSLLPGLANSWAWAHAQLAGDSIADRTQLINGLAGNPTCNLSRLVSLQPLQSGTAYLACLVPAFEIGRQAGLSRIAVNTAPGPPLADAWTATTSAPFDLPVYYSWEFQTGLEEDFTVLAKRLQPRGLPRGAGWRDLCVPVLGNAPAVVLSMAGAFGPPVNPLLPHPADTVPPATQAALEAQIAGGATVVGPPLYAGLQAGQTALPAAGGSPAWLRELNLDPRLRAIAGLGAQVVRAQQEGLMASAWDQAGEIREANRVLAQAQLSAAVVAAARDKHLSPVPAGEFLQITRPAHSRLMLTTDSHTIRAEVQLSNLPNAAVSPALRKAARPRGPIGRQLPARLPGAMIDDLNSSAAASRLTVAPPRALPPGMADPLLRFATPDGVQNAPGWPPLSRSMIGGGSNDWDSAGVVGLPLSDAETQIEAVRTAFRDAARAQQIYLAQVRALSLDPGTAPPPGDFPLGTAKTQVLARMDPAVALKHRVDDRLNLLASAAAGAGLFAARLFTPSFPAAMAGALHDLAPDLLFPNAEQVPADTVALLEPNQRFVEAFLCGLNHEMAREFLWREFPADLRGTYFRHFGTTSTTGDIQPIKDWAPAEPLGGHGTLPSGHAVLLLRGELIRRYPRATIYAAPAVLRLDGRRIPSAVQDEYRYPLFRMTLGADMLVAGFNLTVADARGLSTDWPHGWYFVVQEQPAEPRFGRPSGTTWANSAAVAAAAFALQRPVRIAFHGSGLLVDAPAPELYVEWVSRPQGGAIVALGGRTADGLEWAMSRDQVVDAIQRGHARFYIAGPDGRPNRVWAQRGRLGRTHVQTRTDPYTGNNLLKLPRR